MYKFIDKYTEFLCRDKLTPNCKEDKLPYYKDSEESYKVLEALNETQNKQRRQKKMNYVIEEPDEVQVSGVKVEEQRSLWRAKAGGKHSQSVVLAAPVVKENLKVKSRSKHRRTESINLDSTSVKRMMNMQFDPVTLAGKNT
eukprot:TRINITY_DN1096_c0_g2_i4.p1 TRINITY_DN1096_c0_g2~~TRINITY_DN1096_c0_g2_i4.p1  ORF type:complete len:142 (+),score=51.39 TRINITY_DN1096_c0_g2_i4:358-783(+)